MGIFQQLRNFWNRDNQRSFTDAAASEMELAELKGLAVQALDESQWGRAIDYYARALDIRPESAEAHLNLGYACFCAGRYGDAGIHLTNALQLDQSSADAAYLLGLTRREQSDPLGTAENLQRAIDLRPGFVEAYPLLCQSLAELQRLDEARHVADQALFLNPDSAIFQNCLGNVLYLSGHTREALRIFRRSIELDPQFAEAYSNLGRSLHDLREYHEAEAALSVALKMRPGNAGDLQNLGLVRMQLGDGVGAVECLRQAVRLNPMSGSAFHALGDAYRLADDLNAAISAYKRALLIEERDSTHNNLGIAYQEIGRVDEARAAFEKAIQIKPAAVYWNNLACIQRDSGSLAESLCSYEKALSLDPGYCEALGNLIYVQEESGFSCPTARLELCRRYGDVVSSMVSRRPAWMAFDDRPARLKIGFVSGDFRNHPVGYFIESILSDLRRGEYALDLFAYPSFFAADELSNRLERCFEKWQPIVGLSDEAAAELIARDGVHVLVDLSGHTAHNRLPMFAWKPAPVQVSWLGYFATTGVKEIDYLLADLISVPQENRAFFTERLVNFKHARLCFSPPVEALEVSAAPSRRNGYVTFGCFQKRLKVSDQTLALWAKVLQSIPDSRLRWQSPHFTSEASRQRERARLTAFDIDRDRVTLHPHTIREKYFAEHGEVDMILDTFPYPGGTTTCEALWMGVPTLTLAGDTMLSRQGASLLSAAGLREWVAWSQDEFVEKAVSFGRNDAYLSDLRSRLRKQIKESPLMDAESFAAEFNSILWAMWADYASGRPRENMVKSECNEQPSR